MSTEEVASLYERYVIPVYNRVGIALSHGKGSWVWDEEGRRYLDFFPGWGVDALGHCPAAVIRSVQAQVKSLIHVANTYYHKPQALLARELIRHSFDGKAFFTNSGAETVEAAIKLVRKFGNPNRWEILTLERSFHGRTLAAVAATGQEKIKRGFDPLPTGFRHVPLNDLKALEGALRPETVAVMMEPIQGEGGIRLASKDYLKDLRKLCNERKLLLIFDEIQTGMGRTGTLFYYQQVGVTPDILLLAKAVAGGLPMGVLIARRGIADTWEKASHATTFGGNPLVTAAGLATLQMVLKKGFLQGVQRKGRYLKRRLKDLQERYPIIQEIRGVGLMLGIELKKPGAPIVERAAKNGLLLNCTQEKILRMLPPLTVTKGEMDQAISLLEKTLQETSR